MRFDLTKIQVEAIAAHLRYELLDDERAYLDTLEGETDLYELTKRLLDQVESDEGVEATLTLQIADRQARKQRAADRVKANRTAIMALLECAKLDKLVLPEATITLRDTASCIVVNDPAAVPDEYTIPNPKPNLEAIKAAYSPDSETLPNWLRVEPSKTSLTIRRK